MSEFKGLKPRVRKSFFPYTGQMLWQAGVPGGHYVVDGGFHFDPWEDAVAYALHYWDLECESS